MPGFFDLSDPNSSMPLLGLLQGLGAAAAPSRMPVPFGQAIGSAAEGYMKGLQSQQQQQIGAQDLALKQLQMQQYQTQLDAWKKIADMQASGGGGAAAPNAPPQAAGAATTGATVPTTTAKAVSTTGAPLADSLTAPTGNFDYSTLGPTISGAERNPKQPTAKNPQSSAAGIDQFTDATWLKVVRGMHPEWANIPDADIKNLRNDNSPQGQQLAYDATAELGRQNAPILQKAGVPINGTTLYAAHYLGADRAAKVLSAPAGTPMSSLVPENVIAVNRPDMQGKTNTEFLARISRRLGQPAPAAPVDTGEQAPAPAPPTPASPAPSGTQVAANAPPTPLPGTQAAATATDAAPAQAPEAADVQAVGQGVGGQPTPVAAPAAATGAAPAMPAATATGGGYGMSDDMRKLLMIAMGPQAGMEMLMNREEVIDPSQYAAMGIPAQAPGTVLKWKPAQGLGSITTAIKPDVNAMVHFHDIAPGSPESAQHGGLGGKQNDITGEFTPYPGQVQGVLPAVNTAIQSGAMGTKFLQQLPPAYARRLAAMADGTIKPLGDRQSTSPAGAQMQTALQMAFPDYTGNEWKQRQDATDYYTKGKGAATFNSVNAGSQHLQEMRRLIVALNQHDNATINDLGARIRAWSGKDIDVTNLNAIQSLAASEIANMTIGGGTSGGGALEDRNRALGMMGGTWFTAKQALGVLDNVVLPMARDRINTQWRGWTANRMPADQFGGHLEPAARAIWGGPPKPSDKSVQLLMSDPDKYKQQFDETFGLGAANRYLLKAE